ncbi:hypothetical protein RJZ56_004183 [Blastomyces dermatitidis]|uniref:DNA repair protein Swi5/Sae3 n=3 Tax=Blastomyces TaxID=229219 RepID=A0A179UI17_BLAGS|nr:DNA repair protein Swi5/Sae3 [Blastomyces gilchristii SLH14081]XP_045274448.1 DNA repair protein Swi5/Sae3 [Blastomyces dermatitidis ER-3]EGE79833.1 DNA repair protein Swi5/Sae3 [Blastomyces dermatitidis ATCC 18188]EQL33243.1 DNA repair protein Swi5/Sae3 [Blastomyces dermatitidis ATCC 26199]EEQ87039.1 DNA repair protein Swi5/Sae3 [Blastomyces dermatitidis ER-3]OAT07695.1 DNA repair protein Swi5/Sae3 [Blastomyces gilchristii SLH14081]
MAHPLDHIPVANTEQATSSPRPTASPASSLSRPEPDPSLLGSPTPSRYSDKHEKMIKSLTSKISTLHSEISKTEALLSEAQVKLNPPNTQGTGTDKDAAAIVQRHIRLLHEYNEIKDIGQGLMGLIAEARGVRYVEVQRDFGVEAGD